MTRPPQKAGIFKPGSACFAVPQPGHAAFRVLEEEAALQGQTLIRIKGPLDPSVPLGVQGERVVAYSPPPPLASRVP